MSETLDEIGFLQWLIADNDYRDPKPIAGGRYACIRPMLFTYGIITGKIGDFYGVDDHWCYGGYAEAKAALLAWNGTGEPSGWHRHPRSGRRVARGFDEVDGDGNSVEPGAIYFVRD